MLKKIVLLFIKFIPLNNLKIFLYRNLLGYKIGENVIIKKSIINCNKVNIGNDVLIESNSIILCNEFCVGEKSKILSGNIILGNGNFTIGTNSRIINNHYFDLWNDIYIGNNTWIAGKYSQFWTHGSLKTKSGANLSIIIGDNVYVGSGVKFSPGTIIANKNLIGLGAVVSGVYEEEKTIIAGNLATIIKKNIYWRDNW